MKKTYFKKILILALVFLFLGGFSFLIYKENTEQISYIDFIQKVQNSQIDTVFLTDGEKIRFKEKDVRKVFITDNPRSEDFKQMLLENAISVKEVISFSSTLSSLLGVTLIAIMGFILYKRFGKTQKSSIVIKNFKECDDGAICFDDIAGNEEAKENAKDIIDFLKYPEKYEKIGARIPKGIMFYGEPGTGKTLIARAIASEAKVPFFSVCGSDFVEMYVGVGASRVRSLFKKAREHKKAVIFIDEIDAIGKKRGANLTNSNDEKDQTLNALLSEMSGFSKDSGIVVIATTNRLELLDDALLRAGRFDRHIEILLPDRIAREKIIKLYLKNKNIDTSVDIQQIAKKTVYFSGAMLENLINEASIIAIKEQKEILNIDHIDRAYLKIMAGDEKKERSYISEQDKKITAFHEAGHAILTKILDPSTSISRISIIPTTKGTGGFCLNIFKDKLFYSKKDLENKIMIAYGGRAAEEIIFGKENITTGAYNDIEKATNTIIDYVSKFGFSYESGLLNLDKIAPEGIKEKYTEISLALYEKAISILKDNKHYLFQIANILIENETLDEDEINLIFS